MNDIEKLLNSTLPFVKDLLKKYGEFFPLASAIKPNDSVAQVGTYDVNEKPLSDKLTHIAGSHVKNRQKSVNNSELINNCILP